MNGWRFDRPGLGNSVAEELSRVASSVLASPALTCRQPAHFFFEAVFANNRVVGLLYYLRTSFSFLGAVGLVGARIHDTTTNVSTSRHGIRAEKTH